MSKLFSLIHDNKPVTEIRILLKFCHVEPGRCWHDASRPLLRIARFLPASWTVQRRSVEGTSKSRPSHLPWCRLNVRAVAVPSHNLRCKYYTKQILINHNKKGTSFKGCSRSSSLYEFSPKLTFVLRGGAMVSLNS